MLKVYFTIFSKKKYEMQMLCKGLLVNWKDISLGGENSSFKSKISAVSTAAQMNLLLFFHYCFV